METNHKPVDERKQILSRQIGSMLTQGRRVESQSDFQAVLLRGHAVNHILHLIITIVTLGFWGIVWIALAVLGGEKRELVQVDEWGNPTIARL